MLSLAFSAAMLGSGGQLAIQYVSKVTTAALLLFGAKAVIDGELTVGALVAFNMIASQAVQPILRLSQIWQDFQQVQISIERLGDILNAPPEPYTRERFDHTYTWTLGWGLVPAGATYENTVDNRAW